MKTMEAKRNTRIKMDDKLYKTIAVVCLGYDGRYYIRQSGDAQQSDKEDRKEYRLFDPESPVMPSECKKGISYSADENKPLRNDSSAKSANPYPQDAENDEYRYIDAGWLEKVAQGLTAGARKHPGETWRQIPPEEHAARAMRHLNLYRAGDRKDTHLINAAMRCMMAYATEETRGDGKA